MSRPGGWAAIFDWDGVVVDSSRKHEESWERLGKEERRPLPEGHFRMGFGMKNERIIPGILGWTQDEAEVRRLSLRKEALFREIVREGTLEPLPGISEWLDRLATARIPCAIASSTHRENIELALELMHFRRYFGAVVTSEDVSHGKPDPEVFVTAAQKLGYPAGQGVVFEDAHVGIRAARAGGFRVVAVATTHPLGELGDADLAVERLDQLDLEMLDAWFA